ncbi:MAG: hypothetical protein MHM6MM_002429 [Cercozoa sp. M6MM]
MLNRRDSFDHSLPSDWWSARLCLTRTARVHRGKINRLALNRRTAPLLVAASSDGKLSVSDALDTRHLNLGTLNTAHEHGVDAVDFLRETTVLSGDFDGILVETELETGTLTKWKAATDGVNDITSFDENVVLLACDNGTVCRADGRTGRIEAIFDAEDQNVVNHFAASENGGRLRKAAINSVRTSSHSFEIAAAVDDGAVRIFDSRRSSCRTLLPWHHRFGRRRTRYPKLPAASCDFACFSERGDKVIASFRSAHTHVFELSSDPNKKKESAAAKEEGIDLAKGLLSEGRFVAAIEAFRYHGYTGHELTEALNSRGFVDDPFLAERLTMAQTTRVSDVDSEESELMDSAFWCTSSPSTRELCHCNNVIVGTGRRGLTLWHGDSGAIINCITTPSAARCVLALPDAGQLVVGGSDGCLHIISPSRPHEAVFHWGTWTYRDNEAFQTLTRRLTDEDAFARGLEPPFEPTLQITLQLVPLY